MDNKPNIALVGNAPEGKEDLLNTLLSDEDLGDLCNVYLYGADGQPELEALNDAIEDYADKRVSSIVCLPMEHDLLSSLEQMTREKGVLLEKNGALAYSSLEGCSMAAEGDEPYQEYVDRMSVIARSLRRDLGVLNPRIAIVLKADTLESDEAKTVKAVVDKVVAKGIQVFGPVAGESLFASADYASFDAVVAMRYDDFHDAFLEVSSDEPISLVTAVTIPTTTSRPEEILRAIFLAVSMARSRVSYDKPFADPLPKLYHERREDGEKARFAVKKKGFNPSEHRRENLNAKSPKESAS